MKYCPFKFGILQSVREVKEYWAFCGGEKCQLWDHAIRDCCFKNIGGLVDVIEHTKSTYSLRDRGPKKEAMKDESIQSGEK